MIECRAPLFPAEKNAYFDFRWRMLREPWGQPRGSERDELENQAIHRVIVDNHVIVAIGRLHIDDKWVGHVRFVATEPNLQGNGLGKSMMEALEQEALKRGVSTVKLHARASALAFYDTLGYENLGESHKLYDQIQHYSMSKSLKKVDSPQVSLQKKLQNTWHQTIPLSKAMGISADYYDGKTFITHCDFAFNKNLHNTMFAGSIYSLATLTGWGWIYLQLAEAEEQGDIVLADASIRYLKPIGGCANAIVIKEEVEGETNLLHKTGKTSFDIKVSLYSGDIVAAVFSGKYVVMEKR